MSNAFSAGRVIASVVVSGQLFHFNTYRTGNIFKKTATVGTSSDAGAKYGFSQKPQNQEARRPASRILPKGAGLVKRPPCFRMTVGQNGLLQERNQPAVDDLRQQGNPRGLLSSLIV